MRQDIARVSGADKLNAARNAIGIGGVVALAAAALMPAAQAVAAGAPASAPIALSGTFFQANGQRGKGELFVIVSPPSGKKGSKVDVPVVAHVVADANGNYSLPLDPTDPSVAAAIAANNGWVNLQVIAISEGHSWVTSMSRAWGGAAAGPEVSHATRQQISRGGWTTREGTLPAQDFHFDKGGTHALTPQEQQRLTALGGISPQTYCNKYVMDSQSRPTTVGELHKWKDSQADFAYGQTADSDIGVGIQVTGQNWDLSGSTHIGSNNGAKVTWKGGDPNNANITFGKQLQSYFQYEDQLWAGSTCPTAWTTVTPVSWNGGASYGPDVSSYDNRCNTSAYGTPYKNDTGFQRTSSRNYRYSGAVNVFGLGLDATSGYSQYVEMDWSFGHGYTWHWMCGNNTDPVHSNIVYAGPVTN